jgi:hypothetical protein
MPTFKDWLAQQAAKELSADQRSKLISEWTGAVGDLFNQIMRWLAEDDSSGVLTVETGKVQKVEEGLGAYDVATMRISLAARAVVDLVPLARNVVGGIVKRGDLGLRVEGRVDMTNGAEKYLLYRAVTPSGKKWVIVDDDDYSVKDLDKDAFEAALQDLLS